MPLYDVLAEGVRSIVVAPGGGVPQVLPPDAWREVGYGEAETVLPLPTHAQPAYALLQEYFAFPRKFHFFDLHHLRGKLGRTRRCELLLRLDRPARSLAQIGAENFALGCTPAINLFNQLSEPIVVDHRHHEYLLVGDRQREANTEVHSVLSVSSSNPDAPKVVTIPSFAATAHTDTDDKTVFWSTRREISLRGDLPGTDVFLTFVDQSNAALEPAEPVLYAHLLCTNRQMAEQVPAGAALVAEGPSQPTVVRCLYAPTAQRNPPLEGETLWRLVSLLTINYQSLVDGSTGTAQLREMLRLFASESRRDHQQIRGVSSLEARPVTAHVGTDAWRGFCRGTHVTLEFEEDAFAGGSSLLMGAVLARFFALYTSVNSFVRLSVRQAGETRKQWEPMTGRQTVL